MLYRKLWSQTINGFVSGYSSGPFLRTTVHLDENIFKSISISPNGRQLISSMSLRHHEKSQRVCTQQRSRGRFGRHSFSSPLPRGWLEPGDKHSIEKDMTCAYHKSEAKVDALLSPEGNNEAVRVEGDLQEAVPWWQNFPKLWVIVLLCFAAFLLCNVDRVNMSIAILPMSKEFNWYSATVGLIRSSFFWGYLLTLFGGIWADKIGGKLVLGFEVVWWSVATILTPIPVRIGLPILLTMRAFMGISEGVAMPAMNNLLSKWIPVSKRSRSLALVYGGMYLGSVARLAFSSILIHKFGWPSVFCSFGSLGSIWFALWLRKAYSTPKEDPELSKEEKKLIMGSSMSKAPVKIMQSIGFLGLASFFTWLSHLRTPALTVLCMVRSQGSDAFSQSGLYSNHQDIGPRYAGVLLGLSNTVGVLVGVFGTAATGYILQRGVGCIVRYRHINLKLIFNWREGSRLGKCYMRKIGSL